MQGRQRTSLLIILCLLLAVAATGSYFLRADVHQRLQAQLEHRLSIANNSVHRWRQAELRRVSNWANHPDLQQLIVTLTKPARAPEETAATPPSDIHAAITGLLQPYLNVNRNRGFIILSPSKIILSADRSELIGSPSPLLSQPHISQRALAGEALLSNPLRAEMPMVNRFGKSTNGLPTQFSIAPIHDETGHIVALLALRIDLLADFTPLLSQLDFGNSGEVLMFNRAGKLLSESRFLAMLPTLGLSERPTAMLEISLEDPLRDLRLRPKGVVEQADLPLTHSVQSAIANGRGHNLSGYRDYRGIDVVGAWLWDDQLNLGFAVEIDSREALASYYIFLATLVLITAIGMGITLYLVITGKSSQQKLGQYYREKSSILDNTPAFIYIRDLHGRVLFANRQAAEVFNIPPHVLPLWAAEQTNRKSLPYHRELLSQRHQVFIDQEDDLLLRDKTAFTYEAMLEGRAIKSTFIITKFPIRNERGVIYAIGTSGIDITQRLETEQKLSERDRFQANLMANLPGAVYRCRQEQQGWALTYISHGSIGLLGQSSSTLTGDKTTYLEDLMHIDDRNRIADQIRSALTSGMPYQLEFRQSNQSPSKWLWARGRIFEVNGQMITEGFLSDITERKSVEEELAAHRRQLSSLVTERTRELDRERERLNDIIRGAADGIVSCNSNHTITLYSPAAQKLLGYSQEEAIGQSVFDCFSPANAEILRDDIEALDQLQAPQAAREIDLLHKSGETVRAEISISRNTTHGMINYTFILRDVSVRLEQQLALENAKHVAEEASQAKSNFLANISHEIRTPLNAIIGMNQLALRTPLNNKQSRYLKTIEYSSHTLLGIINDVLDFSKIEAGKLEIEHIPFNLESSLEAISQMTAARAQEKGVDFLLDIDPQVPAKLYGDPLRISQILTNLCSNATKFTEQGHITLGAKFVSGDEKTVTLEFFVADTGIGLSDPQRAQLFQAFSQADASVTRKYGGTGLGLSICRELINLMGGNIAVDSKQGVGSRFSFQLTFDCDPATMQVEEGRSYNRNLSVLVVEPDADTAKLLNKTLENFEHAATVCHSGEQALVRIDDSSQFDLILLNWQQPGVSGENLIAQIDAAAGSERPPLVVMLTSKEESESSDVVRGSGADGLLFKPISSSQLLNTITQLTQPATERRLTLPNATNIFDIPDQFRGARILIVEDNEINQEIAREIFETAGFHISLADNGKEALDRVANDKLDLVLMDIQMPIMDGETATQQIRAAGHRLPIIAMTANAFRDDEQRCLAKGMNAYLTKPINIEKALICVCHWLSVSGFEASPRAAHHIPSIATDKNTTWPTDLPGMNTQRAMLNCGGSYELYLKLLEDFSAGYDGFIASLDELLQTQQYTKAHFKTHSLKGVSGNLGAQRLYESCTQLDNNLRKPTPDASQIPAQFFSLTKAWEQFQNNLEVLGVKTNATEK
ncbi:response regulator [Simiduia aestuariiviva]|uniref:Sensory/regulatory protein RpfC n=1 Tax=Simiduia aestuariiviva TaxID=1510459 RepID=A0A839UN73_9GAMM|nr:response regulator [Simiduia aestuariiviva]MBB3169292.1 PAS domain S-box-containing protein [Simiduia aestuariiviva]